MLVMKRNGNTEEYNPEKVLIAVTGASYDTPEEYRIHTESALADIEERVYFNLKKQAEPIPVEIIQDYIEDTLMRAGYTHVAREFIKYRYEHKLRRDGDSTDKSVLGIIDYENQEVKDENSNKNPEIIPTQRDYIAGEVTKSISRRMLLPKDVMQAHDEGRIHVHDLDYFALRMSNCELTNLEDMLQNGTVISDTKVERPHTFSTACTIATQIIAQVCSNTYGLK